MFVFLHFLCFKGKLLLKSFMLRVPLIQVVLIMSSKDFAAIFATF